MRVIFCLPGKTFSSNYFNSWNSTLLELQNNKISYAYSMTYDPVVYYTRNRLLGGNNTLGRNQKPWNSQINYDVMVWIDSDMVWKPDDIMTLINHNKPIVSGTYLMSDGNSYPIVENLDFKHLSSIGTFKFMDREAMQQKTSPFFANYTGFGFLAIKAGVIETMEYPWFRPRWITDGNFHDFCAEDVGFCWSAQELGHEIWVDPSINVGHEKTLIL